MAWIDVVIVIIVISLIVHGVATGLIRSAFDFAGIICGYIIAVTYSATVRIPQILAFLLIFIAVVVAFSIVGRIIAKMVHITPLGLVDRILGGLLGLIKGVIICFVLLLAVTYMKKDWEVFHESQFASQIIDAGLRASRFLPPPLHEWIEEVFGRSEIALYENHNIPL
ncbi:MAG: CvpA family protein [candidate division WOR-3 bacterium]|nr:MAG: CvpA family protein [candidate division WOR-3 bacterium]